MNEKYITIIEDNKSKSELSRFLSLVNNGELDYLINEIDKQEINSQNKKDSEFVDVVVSETNDNKIFQLIFIIFGFIAVPIIVIMDSVMKGEFNVILLICSSIVGILSSIFYFKGGVILKINRCGLHNKVGKVFEWNQIDFIYLKTVKHRSHTNIYLVVNMNSEEVFDIDVSYADKDLKTLGKIVYILMKRFKNS